MSKLNKEREDSWNRRVQFDEAIHNTTITIDNRIKQHQAQVDYWTAIRRKQKAFENRESYLAEKAIIEREEQRLGIE